MFTMNGILWSISFVSPNSKKLLRSDMSRTVGMTDNRTHTIYLSSSLKGDFFERVLCHELCHAVCMSYNISLPIQTEEWLCNFMADHGKEVIYLLDDLLFSIQYCIA